MKAKEIRRRTSTDLREEIKRLGTQVFDSRFRSQAEEKTDRGLVLRTRREVARIQTILHERELGLAPEPASGKTSGETAPAAKALRGKKLRGKKLLGKKKE